jgi:hypothetical protein
MPGLLRNPVHEHVAKIVADLSKIVQRNQQDKSIPERFIDFMRLQKNLSDSRDIKHMIGAALRNRAWFFRAFCRPTSQFHFIHALAPPPLRRIAADMLIAACFTPSKGAPNFPQPFSERTLQGAPQTGVYGRFMALPPPRRFVDRSISIDLHDKNCHQREVYSWSDPRAKSNVLFQSLRSPARRGYGDGELRWGLAARHIQ